MQYEKQQKTITHLQEYYDKNHARASTAKSAQSKLKQMERMDVLPPAKDLPKPDFKFKSEYLRDGIILEVNDLLVGYDHVLLPPLKYTINAGEKIIITGFNGIGKSTMIKTLLGLIPKLGGEYK
jgi:ATPase subunit of ABC transporter with duplicated ATPase domains